MNPVLWSSLVRLGRRLPEPVRRGAGGLLRRAGIGPSEPLAAWVERWGVGQPAPPLAVRQRTYRAVRDAGGALEVSPGTWLVARHDLLKRVLRDNAQFTLEPRVTLGPMSRALSGLDGRGRHLALRDPLLAAFGPQALGDRGPWIREVARDTLGAMAAAGARDVDAGFVRPLTTRLLADLLGLDVPAEVVTAWAPHAPRFALEGPGPDDASFRAAAGRAYERARQGEGSVLAALPDAEPAMASPDAFAQLVAILLLAGVETTRATMLAALYALLDHPEVEAAARADRSLLPAVTVEALRLKPSDAVIPRRAAGPATLGPAEVAVGDLLYGLAEAANRDPDVFDDPDAFRLGRTARALSFGYGPHYCPGHFWAREEVVGALDAALDAWPSLAEALDPAERDGRPFLGRNPGPLRFRPPAEARR